ncbi:39S ribosomal protein L49, mitochondrial [Protopterus annectens]|uniref:39S ribosomal protein L49, mitochondrial n=1 Tax=Protopterus annectens TaxID=7888 RepID=UPI001CFB3791|nr:39S ribosomal protein L49, mitochondrial [Protopterus annectens]
MAAPRSIGVLMRFLRLNRFFLSSHINKSFAVPSLRLQNCTVSTNVKPEYPVVIESTDEFKFVERLIPPTRIPEPPNHDKYPTPSGWKPPQDPLPDLPYQVRRSRMHNIPVYTDITHASRKITIIRKIEGDIWALEKELEQYLKQITETVPPIQVNEVSMSILIKGHFDKELKSWLLDKGF